MTNHTTLDTLPQESYLDVADLLATMEALTGVNYAVDGVTYRHKALVPCSDLPFAAKSSGIVIFYETNIWGAYICDKSGEFHAYGHQRFAAHISMMNEIEEIAASADLDDYEGYATEYRLDVPVATSRQADHDVELPVQGTLIIADAQGRTLTLVGGAWMSQSESTQGKTHTTLKSGLSCTCKGHRYHKKCWHRALVAAHAAQTTQTTQTA